MNDLRGDDYIDSRDVRKRIEELEARLEGKDGEDRSEDDLEELEALKQLEEECASTEHWHHGARLISEEKWEEFARQYAQDVHGLTPQMDSQWPFTHIDWDEAADELKEGFLEVQFGDYTYYINR